MSDYCLWERIKGHDRPIELLRGVIDKGRPTHAYLFCGPRGVGKAKTAVSFAAALNCADACGVCESCRAVLNRTHPEFHYLEPEGARGILLSQITALVNVVNLKRRTGVYRVVVIDDAHRLGLEAANALLKTLEEPPEGVVFILVASDLNRVLVTIASRCQRVVFGPLDTAAVGDILVNDQGVDPAEARLAAALTGGVVGEAAEIAAAGLLDMRTDLLSILTDPRLDSAKTVDLVDRISAAAKKRTTTVKKMRAAELAEALEFVAGTSHASHIKKQLEARHKRELTRIEQQCYRQVLTIIGSLYRDLLLISESADKKFVANGDLLAKMEHSGVTTVKIRKALASIEQTGRHLTQNVSPWLAFEHLFLALGADSAKEILV